jgi:hypothetical protein
MLGSLTARGYPVAHASRPPGLGSGLGGHGPARNMQIIRSGDLSDDTTRIALWRSREPRLDTPCRGSMAFVWSGRSPAPPGSLDPRMPRRWPWAGAERPIDLASYSPPQPDRPEGLQQRPPVERAVELAPVLRELQAQGFSARGMAAELNRRGVETTAGGQWHAQTVIRTMRRVSFEATMRSQKRARTTRR